jgi:hypothetical protein
MQCNCLKYNYLIFRTPQKETRFIFVLTRVCASRAESKDEKDEASDKCAVLMPGKNKERANAAGTIRLPSSSGTLSDRAWESLR